MAELYGKLGDGVIHVHHLRELASLGEEYEVDPIKDLRPVCPNCHAILHNSSPAMTIEKLRKALAGRKPVRWPTKIK
jgi:5-methylcytosine-specific restriction protein A